LLLKENGLVKTVNFKQPKYVGDPINAVKVFNDKEVDELMFLDISATAEKRGPKYVLVESIASEAFMPFGYGGGITNMEQVEKLFSLGVEKVGVNTHAVEHPKFISEVAAVAGRQSMVVSMDVKRGWFGKYKVFTHCGTKATDKDPVAWAKEVEQLGAGEILVNSIDRDGTMSGYDLELLEKISAAVTVPVIACGGAGTLEHFSQAINAGASAVAAGSMFVFKGPHRAVLISYPSPVEIAGLKK
jgi:cyclase